MKISELESNQKQVTIEAEVTEISPVKEFSRFGKTGRVASAVIEDDSGKIQLTLWDDQIEMVKKGDKVKIIGGYVKEWQGEKQLNAGRFGSIEVVRD